MTTASLTAGSVQAFFLAAAVAATSAGCSGPASLTPATTTPFGQHTAATSQIQTFNDLQGKHSYYVPTAIAAGPEGDLWATDDIDQDFGESAVVKVATTGKRLKTYYYQGIASEGSSFADIAEGPDGNLWVTDSYNEQILQLTPRGKYTGFPLSGPPDAITAGPDGALWFTFQGPYGSVVGRITTGGTISTFASDYLDGAQVHGITAGSDGALWFTISNYAEIGRITTQGQYTLYSKGISSGSQPYSIASGPDGALWFTEWAGGRIGRITTSGKAKEFSQGISTSEEPIAIAAGPDKALWFTEYESFGSYQTRAARIGRITTKGAITEYAGFPSRSTPIAIAAGADGNMWFVQSATDELGRVNLGS